MDSQGFILANAIVENLSTDVSSHLFYLSTSILISVVRFGMFGRIPNLYCAWKEHSLCICNRTPRPLKSILFSFSFRPFDLKKKKFVITITGQFDDLEKHATPEGIKALLASHTGRNDIVFGDFEWLSHFRYVIES